jgi:hypothetical protein
VRTALVLVAAAAAGFAVWLVFGSSFADEPVTKAQIEREVAKRPRGNVQVVLCNEVFVPAEDAESDPPQTWTCDTYLGPNKADAQNGPSYEVKVSGDRIRSIRRVATH